MAGRNSTAPTGAISALRHSCAAVPDPDARDDASIALAKASALIELVRQNVQMERYLNEIHSREERADSERLIAMDPEEARRELRERMNRPAPSLPSSGDLGQNTESTVPNALHLAFEQIEIARRILDGRPRLVQ